MMKNLKESLIIFLLLLGSHNKSSTRHLGGWGKVRTTISTSELRLQAELMWKNKIGKIFKKRSEAFDSLQQIQLKILDLESMEVSSELGPLNI